MASFGEDFLTNLQNNLLANTLSVPSGLSNGYSAYISFTNVFLGGSYAAKLVAMGRTIESTAISYGTGSTPPDWSGVANAAGSLIVGGIFVAFAPATATAAALGFLSSILAGTLSQTIYQTFAQHPEVPQQFVDGLVETVDDVLDFVFEATSGLVEAVYNLTGDAVADLIDNILDNVVSPLLAIVRDPLVLDLDGDGIETSNLSSSVIHFDYSGDGHLERTGWASSDDGMLAIDVNNNGAIDSGLELFAALGSKRHHEAANALKNREILSFQ